MGEGFSGYFDVGIQQSNGRIETKVSSADHLDKIVKPKVQRGVDPVARGVQPVAHVSSAKAQAIIMPGDIQAGGNGGLS